MAYGARQLIACTVLISLASQASRLRLLELEDKPRADGRRYQYSELSNGLKVLNVQDASSKKSAVSMGVRAGSFDDPKDLPGLAHFCEHMLFLGTQKHPEPTGFMDFLARSGGQTNAYTNNELTVYYADFMSDATAEGMERFADFFRAPLFSKEGVKKEVHAIDSEHQKNVQDPTRRVLQVVEMLANPASRVNHFPTGNYDTLFTRPKAAGIDPVDALKAYFKERYCPEQMQMVTVGPQSLEEQLQLTKKHFADIEQRDECLHRTTFASPPPYPQDQLSKWVVIEGVQPQAGLWLYFPLPDIRQDFLGHPLVYIDHVLTYAGEGSMLTILKEDLGLISGMRSLSDPTSAGTGYYIYFGLTPTGAKHPEIILDVLFSYVARMKHDHVDMDLYGSISKALELKFNWTQPSSPADTAKDYAERMTRLPPESLISGDTRVDILEPKKVANLIQKLTPSNLIAVFVPSANDADAFPADAKVQTLPYFNFKYAVMTMSQALPESLKRWTSWLSMQGLATAQQQLLTRLQSAGLGFDALAPKPPGKIEGIPQNLSTKHLHADEPGPSAAAQTFGPQPSLLALPPSTSDRRLELQSSKVWYRSGWKTTSPKVSLDIFLRPYVGQGEQMPVLDQLRIALHSRLLMKVLAPKLVDLTVTGQAAKVSESKDGISFSFTGYAPTLPQLIDKVVLEFNKFNANGTARLDSQFNRSVEELREDLLSYSKMPVVYAISDKKVLLSGGQYSDQEELAVLEQLQPRSVQEAVIELLLSRPLAIDALVMGNVGTEQAEAAVAQLSTGILLPGWAKDAAHNQRSSKKQQIRKFDEIVAPARPVEVRSKNPRAGDPNDVVFVAILQGVATVESRAIGSMLSGILKTKLYTQLRTEEQLGYVVTGGSGVMSNVQYTAAIVQGSVRSADEMELAVESVLLKSFPEHLKAMTEEDFQHQKAMLMQQLLQPAASDAEETKHFRGHVEQGAACFNLLDEVLSFVNSSKFSRKRLEDSWAELMSPKNGLRNKVTIKYFANEVPEPFNMSKVHSILTDRGIEKHASQLSAERAEALEFGKADSVSRDAIVGDAAGRGLEAFFPTELICNSSPEPAEGSKRGFLSKLHVGKEAAR